MQFQRLEYFDKYLLLDRLGEGGMGEVWLAKDPALIPPVAIKFLLSKWMDYDELIHRFEEEARILSVLEDGPVVGIKTLVRVRLPDGQEVIGIVMPFLSGGSVEDLLFLDSEEGSDPQPQPVPLRASITFQVRSFSETTGYKPEVQRKQRTGGALQLGLDILAAVGWIHQKGVVHRDIKPSNFMLTRDGEVRLTDFGIARREERSRITRVGAKMGSPEYMSPEQRRGSVATSSSDIYSVGVTLYELMTGELPDLHQGLVLTLPSETAAVNAKLAVVLEKAMAPTPATRWQSCEEFAEALRQVSEPLVAVPLTSAPLTPMPTAAGVAGGKKLAVASAAALLVLSLTAGSIYLTSHRQKSATTDNESETLLGEALALEARQPCAAASKAEQATLRARDAAAVVTQRNAAMASSRLRKSCNQRQQAEAALFEAKRMAEPCAAAVAASKAVTLDAGFQEALDFLTVRSQNCHKATGAGSGLQGKREVREQDRNGFSLPNTLPPPVQEDAEPRSAEPTWVRELKGRVRSLRDAGKFCSAYELLMKEREAGRWHSSLEPDASAAKKDCNSSPIG